MSDANRASEPLKTIVATGRDRRSALAALIAGMNDVLDGDELMLSGRSIRFDAERSTFAETTQAMLAAALELAGEESSAGVLMLDGLIRTDDGFVGWGSLLLGDAIRTQPVPVLHALDVEQEPGGWRLTAVLRI